MPTQILFIIGAPRSGTTMLEHMLSSHSMIKGGSEPHLLTPLAHLGVWRNVEKAPYDHIIAGIGQKDFINKLENKHDDYWAACRAYCDSLYSSYMQKSNKTICMDKTPEYATILPFINYLYPDAKYIVLTRHPIAIFSSFAESFFDGNYEIAWQHDNLFKRYISPIADFLRQPKNSFIHIRYEDLVSQPEDTLSKISDYLNIPYEETCINYGNSPKAQGLGDPLGVVKYSKPSLDSLDKWAEVFVNDDKKLSFMRKIANELDPDDLKILGYDYNKLWYPLEKLTGKKIAPKNNKLTSYRLQRKMIVLGRKLTQKYNFIKHCLEKVRLSCDVLLREY